MTIEYKINAPITTEQFIALLRASTLGVRRPLDNAECMAAMLANAPLVVTAWQGLRLVGVARSLTDFHYCCYLSDLAVDEAFQRRGIGKELIAQTRRALKPKCKLILLAAPAANDYYPHIGFTHNARCWMME